MFKRIVKFEDGTYAVRKWNLLGGFVMLDIRFANFWWCEKDNQLKYCRGTLEEAKKALNKWNYRNGKSIK